MIPYDDLTTYCRTNFALKHGALYRVCHAGHPLTPRRSIGYLNKRGYFELLISLPDKPRKIPVHRIVFFLAKGYWPIEVDHKNTNRQDNRPSNLREATRPQNARNHGPFSTNRHKLPAGICRRSIDGRYLASVQIAGKTRSKLFGSLKKAIAHRRKWAKTLYGAFAPSHARR